MPSSTGQPDNPNMENTTTAPAKRLIGLRITVAVAAILIGGMITLVTAAVGHCSAFGGRCPRPDTFDGDVFRGAALGTWLAVTGAMWMRSPSWRGLLRALLVAAMVAIPVGALVMVATQG